MGRDKFSPLPGCSKHRLSRYEQGRQSLLLAAVRDFSQKPDVPLDTLVGGLPPDSLR